MSGFDYAHNDTSVPERASRTACVNGFKLSEDIKKLREDAFLRGIPVSSDETLAFLCICVQMAKPKKILEIGTAIGVSGICMLDRCPSAQLTTIERDSRFASEAENNFASAHMGGRAKVICADAAEALSTLDGGYDFIFLDGPKVQYIKYLPQLKRLLNKGGTIFADDVLLYGWVNGEQPVPPKRRMLVEHIKEYLQAVFADPCLESTVVDVGDGVAISIKK